MKYAHINEKNQILGWYCKDIHGDILTPNIEVSDEVWQNAINNGHNKVNKDGTTELFDFRTQEEKQQQELLVKIQEAKQYLASTDFKMSVDYFATMSEEKQQELIKLRSDAREFIRSNEEVFIMNY